MANHFFHDVAGYFMMPLALGMLWVELKVLSSLIVEAPARPARVPYSQARRPAPSRAPAAPRGRRSAKPKREAPVEAEPTAEKS
jgi:hypothetical protein